MSLAIAVGVLITVILLLLGTWKLWTARYTPWHQPEALPWIGTLLSFPFLNHQFFKWAQEWTLRYQHLFMVWLGPFPFIVSSRADYAEVLLSSKTLLQKSFVYNFMHEWLGSGLLTSYGAKWKTRRRAITPTFHFSILNNFSTIFEEQSMILVQKLKAVVDGGEAVNVMGPLSLAKLDVLCETSMGVHVNAQGVPASDYVVAMNSLGAHINLRQRSPWLWPKFIYKLTSSGREFYNNLDTVHNFTLDQINKSIAQRKQHRNAVEAHRNGALPMQEPIKRQRVFLDMLLDLFDAGEIDIAGIREEVDTFMFEGYGTTSTALSWALYELGRQPHLQEKLHAEIQNADTKLGIAERVKSITYLDYVLKEGLRLHPPVPIFARSIAEDTIVDDKVVPKGTEIGVFTYMLHRNPSYWTDPDTFNPNRFGEEEFLKRNPYIYVPFSAGSRNCVGQKFALLEEKIMMYHIVMNFKFTSMQDEKDLLECMDLVHKSGNGLYLKFQLRNE